MLWVALGLLVVGFVLVTPRGATPGGAAHRNIGLYGQQIRSTPGYTPESPRGAWKLRFAGLAMLAAGVGLLFTVGT